MNVFLHTIALEPARWTPQRVSKPLGELLPQIAEAGFTGLEIFEPHLALATDETALAGQITALGLRPVVLSSYLGLSPAFNVEAEYALQAEALLARVDLFGFRKVRLFPGYSPAPERVDETVEGVAHRLRRLADARPDVEFLVETHDGSLADDPNCMVRLIDLCARPNVGLLWQPTLFERDAARAQFEAQKPLIRHVHLQNRVDGSVRDFATLKAGVIPWADLMADLSFQVDASLEFVPAGICPPERFDLEACLSQAATETAYVNGLAAGSQSI